MATPNDRQTVTSFQSMCDKLAKTLFESLDERMKLHENHLNRQIELQEARFNSRMDLQKAYFNSRMDLQQASFNGEMMLLLAKMDKLAVGLGGMGELLQVLSEEVKLVERALINIVAQKDALAQAEAERKSHNG
jgi:hypothetical protein